MGLFIGASILTVLELFDYAYEVSVSAVPRLPGAQVILEHQKAPVGHGEEPPVSLPAPTPGSRR